MQTSTQSRKMSRRYCPNGNGRVYPVARVAPHYITRPDRIIDPYMYEALSDLLSEETLRHFDTSTRSYYTLDGHYANLWKYDTINIPKKRDRLYWRALDITCDKFKLSHTAQSYGWEELDQVPFVRTSSAGYGMQGKRGDPGNHEHAVKRAVGALLSYQDQVLGIPQKRPFRYTPYVAWTRTQIGTFDQPKIRHVWGAAFENVILEGINAYPLIMAYHNSDTPIVIGSNTFRKIPQIINQCLREVSSNDPVVGVGLDFSGFDQSVQPWLIRDAFDVLKENIRFKDDMARWAWSYSVHHFIHKTVVMPDGIMWQVNSGIPSGSYFTQLIGSIVNHIVITYVQLRIYGRSLQTWVLGDDSLFQAPGSLMDWPDLNTFDQVIREFGMKISPHKSIVTRNSQELEFLGHAVRGLRVSREEWKLLRLVLHSEYPVLDAHVSMSRMEGFLIDSALEHWSIIHLYERMKFRFGSKVYQSVTEDAKWWYDIREFRDSDNEIARTLKVWTRT
uniref:RdRp n=1 Tax=Beihai partiti-like virus 11 TaxID=1922503 RepID=A0A1L3KLB6_9VIRU|nr:RdRp [Beihai partiti-like virus 11]